MFSFACIVAVLMATCSGQKVLETARNPLCKQRNAFYAVGGTCDQYIDCRDYTAAEMFCPDGLHFDPDAVWPAYPCGYPMDVSCSGRASAQAAQPTAECPHQFGLFSSPLATSSDCGRYRVCVGGHGIDMMCPPGLAFNSATARCDWPDLVDSCNADAFLGFKCPDAPRDEFGTPLVVNYKYLGDCHVFYSCEVGRARLLSCDADYAFDSNTGRCEKANKVACSV